MNPKNKNAKQPWLAQVWLWLGVIIGFSIFPSAAWSQTVPSITRQPLSQTVVIGANVTLEVAVAGAGPFAYQWQHDGANITNNLIRTEAGKASKGYSGDGGPATNASLSAPFGAAVATSGGLFFVDQGNNVIRKVNTNGVITTVAGVGYEGYYGDGGPATNAWLAAPAGISMDAYGRLFIVDQSNEVIRKVDPNGVITTVAGNGYYGYSGDNGVATSATLNFPCGVAVDGSGSLFIADLGNNRIRKVNPDGIISTVAGSGVEGFLGDGGAATNARLNHPTCVVLDAAGNLFISDDSNNRIRKLDTNGIITTVAGGGTSGDGDGGSATKVFLNDPVGVGLDQFDNLFISERGNQRVRKVDTNGIITTVAGNGTYGFSGDGGAAPKAELEQPSGAVVDGSGNLYITDWSNNRIREVTFGGFPTLALNHVTAANGGEYQVIVTSPSGGVTSLVATVSVALPPLMASLNSGPGVLLTFSGVPGSSYVLQAATTLNFPASWQPVFTNAADGNGNWTFQDTNAPSYSARFYRLTLP